MQNKERKFLEIINGALAKNSYIGDDCAFLEDFGLVMTQDTLIEGIHFDCVSRCGGGGSEPSTTGTTMAAMTPKQIGRRAILVNISDILASGAKPKYLTVSLSGALDEAFVSEFYAGINEICEEFDTEIVGGDLTGGEKITVSICALGDTAGRQISSRSNAYKGYVIAVRGVFGAGLLSNYVLEPKLYQTAAEIIATKCRKPYALMDSSDSLYDCLAQISRQSGVSMAVEFKKIPSVEDLGGDFKTTLFGGEDYALVGCFDPNDFETVQNAGARLVPIGTVIAAKGVQNGVFIDGKKIEEDFTYAHKF